MYDERESPDFIVWSDEATFKLNGTVNSHNFVYWATENPCVPEEQAVNLLGVSVWCGLSYGGLIGPFFKVTVMGASSLSLLQANIAPSTSSLFLEEECYFQRIGAPPHYHSDVRI
jgi:hypothetical protein